jgi:predicted metal-binding membrane protein
MGLNDTDARVARQPESGDGLALRIGVPVALIGLAGAGWWWSARVAAEMTGGRMDPMAGEMTDGGMDPMAGPMSFAAFVVAWVAMMAAMMLPAILPVVMLYARAAGRGTVAPLPFFVGGYLALWTALAVPAYLAWRALEMPLADGRAWAGRVAGATLLVAALWQVSPLKSACLRHCRSPLGFFMRYGQRLRRPGGALRVGVIHGAFCIGCCWALFAVLVASGSMSLLWLAIFTALIVLEKNSRYGERIALAAAPVLAVLGAALLISPSLITTIA